MLPQVSFTLVFVGTPIDAVIDVGGPYEHHLNSARSFERLERT